MAARVLPCSPVACHLRGVGGGVLFCQSGKEGFKSEKWTGASQGRNVESPGSA